MMNDDIIIGLPQFISKSREKQALIAQDSSIQVGDIVAQLKYYRNGKPIKNYKDYTNPAVSTIGVVVSELYSEKFNANCIKIKWNNGHNDGIYMKDNAAGYLVKLS